MLAEQVKQLIVFDFFSVFTYAERSAIRHTDNICYLSSPNVYLSLQNKLGNCWLPAVQYLPGVQMEAQEYGHTIHYFDENIKVTEKDQIFDINEWLYKIQNV